MNNFNFKNTIPDVRMGNRWLPVFEDESFAGSREISIFTRLFSERKVFLTGTIEEASVNEIVAELLFLSEKNTEPIDIFISSRGGSLQDGLFLYDAIQGCIFSKGITVNMYACGLVASMAALILASGQRGHRFILPQSEVMIHEPLLLDGIAGSASTIEQATALILKKKALTNRLLAKHTGRTIEEIERACSYDHFLSAEEAVEFGICDSIKNIF